MATFEDTIRDGDVLVAAVRLRPKLNAAGARHSFRVRKFFEAAVDYRAFVETAGHKAVGNGDQFSRTRIAERIRTLQTDAVVPRRIHSAVGDPNVAAAVNVHAVAVGVDDEIVDGEIVHAGSENSEMPAVQDR